jgi:hypothetical protein
MRAPTPASSPPEGAEYVESQIDDFLRRALLPSRAKGVRCSSLKLDHLNVERKVDGTVTTFPVTQEDVVDLTAIRMRIGQSAQGDADSLAAGMQQYQLTAKFSDGSSERKVFRVSASDQVFENSGGSSEPPTEKGLTTMLMRHLEVINRQAALTMGGLLNQLREENMRLSRSNEAMLARQLDMAVLVEDTLNDSSKRRIEEKKAESQNAMVSDSFKAIMSLLPIVANKLMGKEILPQASREYLLIGSLFESMDAEQQEFLKSRLRPQQMAILAEILGIYDDQKKTFSNPTQALIQGDKSLENQESRSVSDRLASATQTDDPVLKSLEQSANRFHGRLKSLTESDKPPTKGKPE